MSTDVAGHASGGRDRIDRISGPELLPGRGEGRLLIAGGPGKLVKLIDVSATNLVA